MELIYIFLGLIVGVFVGLTGMGGGALMSPALIFLGLPPRIAIGTDVVYAAVTRFSSSIFHFRKGNVNVKLAFLLLSGSIPGIVSGGYLFRLLNSLKGEQTLNMLISAFLGVVLVAVSLAILSRVTKYELDVEFVMPDYWKLALVGFLVGIIVQFTSVGSGTLLALFLVAFTALSPRKIVGTDNFHGFILTSAAEIAHSALGNVDYRIAFLLILGSIPGSYIGAYFVPKIDAKPLRIILSVSILIAGIIILLQTFI